MQTKTALTLALCAMMMLAGGIAAPNQEVKFNNVVEKHSFHRTKPLYIRIAAIYTGVVNGQWEVTAEMLEEHGHTFIGRKMLLNHDWGDPMAAVGTIIATKVKHDPYFKKDYLEAIVRIDDPVAVDRIKKKLFHFVSIGFTYSKARNSIDGQIWNAGDRWRYQPGRIYTVTKQTLITVGLFEYASVNVQVRVRAVAIIEDMEGQEVSFINVPASRYARVLEYSKKELTID